MKIAKQICCLEVLAAFFATSATEIKFDKELTDLIISYSPGAALDTEIKKSETGSLRLTAAKERKFINIIKIIELDPNRKYEISLMVKGENIVDKRTGIFCNRGKIWDRLSRWTGTFDWTRCTGELDTGKMGGARVKIYITLFGNEGKLWIDQLTITPKDGDASKLDGEKY